MWHNTFMKKKIHWLWKIYFFIYCFPVINNLISLLTRDSVIDQYYQILIAFKKTYFIWYAFNIGSIVIDGLSLIPLYLFIFQKRFLNTFIWKSLFIIRVTLLFVGHSYEWKMIKSFFYADIAIASSLVIFLMLFNIPSYAGCFQYTFHQKKLSL